MTDERRKEIEVDCVGDTGTLQRRGVTLLAAHCRELLAEVDLLARSRENLLTQLAALQRLKLKAGDENAELRELVRQLSERCHAQSELLSRRAEGETK